MNFKLISFVSISLALSLVTARCPNPNVEGCDKGNSGVFCYDGYNCPKCWTWDNGKWDCYDLLADGQCTFSSWINIDNPDNC